MPGYHPGNSYNIVTAPIDSRPVSLDYLKNLVNMGGDYFYSVDKSNLDEGPTLTGTWPLGSAYNVRVNLANLISSRNSAGTTVILNTPSYVNGGLVATRIPNRYAEVSPALIDLDWLTTNYSNPTYYVFIPMPRVMPESRGFNWPTTKDHGLQYFYNGGADREFTILLWEWGYVQNKAYYGYTLDPWENSFLTYFYNKYHVNATSQFIFEGRTYLNWYMSLFVYARDLIKALMDRVKSGKINELVVGLDDINLPDFFAGKPDLLEYAGGRPIKFSWAYKCLKDVKSHHESLYDITSVNLGENGDSTVINYLYGTDEIPQLIYARDLTRRTGFATKFIGSAGYSVDYSKDKDPGFSPTYIGVYDYIDVNTAINQRIKFVTKRGYNAANARNFRFFVHCTGRNGENAFLTDGAGNPEQAALNFAQAVWNSFNSGENVGVLDLGSNNPDWQLFKALGSITGKVRTQLCSYSGWNTVANTAGLGIAHAQVFGMLDYYNATRSMWSYHADVLTTHLLEDGIYNGNLRKISPYKDYFGYMSNYNTYALNLYNNYRTSDPNSLGTLYIMRYLTDSRFPMRLAGNNYIWSTAFVSPDLPLGTNPSTYQLYNITGFPWNRTFEIIISPTIN